ncbi:unnamed protein product [Litomosoides sigmodontis]|uniref:Uncharacterized protein n=1 Tax=Litomosoides sigmodontis TaxID=42156 RepID=A0A3P6S340_LITSI|nr:unnamed protein product [Litomosoides sigmodontis]
MIVLDLIVPDKESETWAAGSVGGVSLGRGERRTCAQHDETIGFAWNMEPGYQADGSTFHKFVAMQILRDIQTLERTALLDFYFINEYIADIKSHIYAASNGPVKGGLYAMKMWNKIGTLSWGMISEQSKNVCI